MCGTMQYLEFSNGGFFQQVFVEKHARCLPTVMTIFTYPLDKVQVVMKGMTLYIIGLLAILHAEASMIIHTQTTHMILVLPGIPTPMPLLEIILENTQGTPTVPLLLVSFILKITQIHLDMQIRICQGVKP